MIDGLCKMASFDLLLVGLCLFRRNLASRPRVHQEALGSGVLGMGHRHFRVMAMDARYAGSSAGGRHKKRGRRVGPRSRRSSRPSHGRSANSRLHVQAMASPIVSSGDVPPSIEDMWAALRQGARNVAGVRWQVAVSVHLLVASRAGTLPFASMTPEGFEDADFRHADGSATFTQMKELGAGAGRLAAADIAEALTHADQAAGDAVVAIVTDAELGSGLLFTGWDGFLAEQGGQPLVDVLGT